MRRGVRGTAWLAGLLEGEGWFAARLPGRPSPGQRKQLYVGLKMNDRDVVEEAARIGEARGQVRLVPERRSANHSDSWTVAWCGADAAKLMRRVLPYMGQRRSAKIRECLATPDLSHTRRKRSK